MSRSQDNVAQGASAIDPEKVPWPALRSLFSESVYGGRIDNRFDSMLLEYVLGAVESVS